MIREHQVTTPLALIVAFGVFWRFFIKRRNHSPLPPGPSAIQSSQVWTLDYPHIQFAAWAKEYGGIFSFKAVGNTTIVLTSPRAVKEVLDTNGAITGGRPKLVLKNRVLRGAFMAHHGIDSEVWKRGNKALHNFFSDDALENHLPTQQAECIQLCNELLDTPEDFVKHSMRAVTSIMVSLAYGKTCPKYENSEAEKFHKLGFVELDIMHTDYRWPDFLLKYVPISIAPWREICQRFRAIYDDLFDPLLIECEKGYLSGTGADCYMHYLLENQSKFGITRDELSGLGLSVIEGNDSSALFVQSLMYTLITFPECQKRAQEEIDRVIGSDRIPTWSDYEDLPYIQALIEEHHRFRPVFPHAFPHISNQDLTVQGYTIPAGSTILLNTWGINRDPDLFDEPNTFKPERYLNNRNGTKPGANTADFRDDFLFGSGRRKCPGKEIGQRFVGIIAMQMIWAFNFEKSANTSPTDRLAMDDNNYDPGMTTAPKSFTCQIIPRNKARTALLREAFAGASV